MALHTQSRISPTATRRPSWTSDQLLVAGTVALGFIWAAVVVISIFAPDNVSGTEQDHVPVAAMITWIWGIVASRSTVTTLIGQRDKPPRPSALQVLVGFIAVVWTIATVVAVFGPELVTGTDPTRVPIAALIAPIAAMVLTTTANQLFASLSDHSREHTEET